MLILYIRGCLNFSNILRRNAILRGIELEANRNPIVRPIVVTSPLYKSLNSHPQVVDFVVRILLASRPCWIALPCLNARLAKRGERGGEGEDFEFWLASCQAYFIPESALCNFHEATIAFLCTALFAGGKLMANREREKKERELSLIHVNYTFDPNNFLLQIEEKVKFIS